MSDEWEALPSGSQWTALPSGAAWSSLSRDLAEWAARTPEEGGEVAPPVNTVAPAIAGLFDWGETLTVTPGTYTGADTVAGQWQRLDPSGPTWSDISGETATTYVIGDALDFPGGVRYRETATNGSGSVSVNSNTSSSPIAAAIAVKPANAWWLRNRGIDATTGDPIDEWRCHNRAALTWDTSSASVRPALLAGGVDFDGLTQHFRGGQPIGELLEGACTLLVGFDGVDTSALTSVRTMICAASDDSTASTRQISVHYSRPDSPNGTRQRVLMHGGTVSQMISLTSLSSEGADGYNIAVCSEGRGVSGGTRCEHLVDPLVQIGPAVLRPSTLHTYEYASLGARAVGIAPTISQYWQGVMRYLAISDEDSTDAELEAIRDALDAAGYLA